MQHISDKSYGSHKSGEITMTVTALAVTIISIGVLVGAFMVSRSQLQQLLTSAQALPEGVKTVPNDKVTVNFAKLEKRSGNAKQFVLNGTLCFTDTPPSQGKFKVELKTKIKDATGALVSTVIGSSLEDTVSGKPANSLRCDSSNARPVQFNAIFSLPEGAQLPSGASCLDNGGIDINLVTSGNGWSPMNGLIGNIGKTRLLCPLALDESPTPLVSPQPADVEVKVNFRGTFTGTLEQGFTKFDYNVKTCDVDAAGLISNCGKNGNRETPITTIDRVIHDQVEITDTKTFTLPANKGGYQALVLFYGYYRADGKKDVSGVKVLYAGADQLPTYGLGNSAGAGSPAGAKAAALEPSGPEFPSAQCLHGFDKITGMNVGQAGCVIAINKEKVQSEINITLPNPTKKTFELSIGRERNNRRIPFTKCSIIADTDDTNRPKMEGDCQAEIDNDGNMSVTYNYIPGTQDELNMYWRLNRCNGELEDQNFLVCSSNLNGEIDVVNSFEAEQLQAVKPLNAYTCKFKASDWPASEAKADVQSKVSCTVKTVTPTATPTLAAATPTPIITSPGNGTPPTTPVPTPVDTKMFTSVSLINSTNKAITKITLSACDQNAKCQSYANTINIPAHQRGSLQQEISKPESGTTVKVGCSITLSDNSQQACPETTVTFPQSTVFKMTVADTGIQGKAQGESQACDISADQCCNAQDFTIIANNYGLTSDADEFINADINGDGIANTVDMLYVLDNINLGASCQYNLSTQKK